MPMTALGNSLACQMWLAAPNLSICQHLNSSAAYTAVSVASASWVQPKHHSGSADTASYTANSPMETSNKQNNQFFQLSNPLLASHPNLLLIRFPILRSRQVPQLYLPNLKLVITAISLSRKEIKRPIVLRACDTRTQGDSKILNVKQTSLRQWKRGMRTLLYPVSFAHQLPCQ